MGSQCTFLRNRGRISPRFRGKYIVHAIRDRGGRRAILIRVKKLFGAGSESKIIDFLFEDPDQIHTGN
jgi:hypothetical protein